MSWSSPMAPQCQEVMGGLGEALVPGEPEAILQQQPRPHARRMGSPSFPKKGKLMESQLDTVSPGPARSAAGRALGLGPWMGVSGFSQFPSHRNTAHVKELLCPFPSLK